MGYSLSLKGALQKLLPGFVIDALMRANKLQNPKVQMAASAKSSLPTAARIAITTRQAEKANANCIRKRPKNVSGFFRFCTSTSSSRDSNNVLPLVYPRSRDRRYLQGALKSGIKPRNPSAAAQPHAAGPENGAHAEVLAASHAEKAAHPAAQRGIDEACAEMIGSPSSRDTCGFDLVPAITKCLPLVFKTRSNACFSVEIAAKKSSDRSVDFVYS